MGPGAVNRQQGRRSPGIVDETLTARGFRCQLFLSNTTTVSMWAVWGNMSTGWMRAKR